MYSYYNFLSTHSVCVCFLKEKDCRNVSGATFSMGNASVVVALASFQVVLRSLSTTTIAFIAFGLLYSLKLTAQRNGVKFNIKEVLRLFLFCKI